MNHGKKGKSRRRKIKAVAAALVWCSLLFGGCNPRELPYVRDKVAQLEELHTQEVKRAIAEDPNLKDLDELCRDIPLPGKFDLNKISSIRQYSLSYYYYSDTKFGEAETHFRQYFTDNGWESVKSNYLNKVDVYRKKDYEIRIQYGGISSDVNYALECENTALSKR